MKREELVWYLVKNVLIRPNHWSMGILFDTYVEVKDFSTEIMDAIKELPVSINITYHTTRSIVNLNGRIIIHCHPENFRGLSMTKFFLHKNVSEIKRTEFMNMYPWLYNSITEFE